MGDIEDGRGGPPTIRRMVRVAGTRRKILVVAVHSGQWRYITRKNFPPYKLIHHRYGNVKITVFVIYIPWPFVCHELLEHVSFFQHTHKIFLPNYK